MVLSKTVPVHSSVWRMVYGVRYTVCATCVCVPVSIVSLVLLIDTESYCDEHVCRYICTCHRIVASKYSFDSLQSVV